MSKKQDKTRELELKITDKKVIDAIINLKLGEERERERIIKIIDNVYIAYEWETRRAIHNIFIRLKQKIKGDEK